MISNCLPNRLLEMMAHEVSATCVKTASSTIMTKKLQHGFFVLVARMIDADPPGLGHSYGSKMSLTSRSDKIVPFETITAVES